LTVSVSVASADMWIVGGRFSSTFRDDSGPTWTSPFMQWPCDIHALCWWRLRFAESKRFDIAICRIIHRDLMTSHITTLAWKALQSIGVRSAFWKRTYHELRLFCSAEHWKRFMIISIGWFVTAVANFDWLFDWLFGWLFKCLFIEMALPAE
jgi:hypothetical protein